eukprot:UN02775
MQPSINGFCVAIGIKGNGMINSERVAMLQKLITPTTYEAINEAFTKNEHEQNWCDYVSIKYPMTINLTNLLVTTAVILFTEYRMILVADLDLDIDGVVRNILLTLLTYFENNQLNHYQKKKLTFPSESTLLYFFRFKISAALNGDGSMKRQPGSSRILYKILKSMTYMTDDTNYYKKKSLKKCILTEIISLAADKSKEKFGATENDTFIARIWDNSTYQYILQTLDPTNNDIVALDQKSESLDANKTSEK